jgi:hypothetical protein
VCSPAAAGRNIEAWSAVTTSKSNSSSPAISLYAKVWPAEAAASSLP